MWESFAYSLTKLITQPRNIFGMRPCVYRAISARNIHCCKPLAIFNNSHQKPAKHIVRAVLIEASVCAFWWIVVLCISLPKRPPTLFLDLPHKTTNTHSDAIANAHTHLETHRISRQVEADSGKRSFDLTSGNQRHECSSLVFKGWMKTETENLRVIDMGRTNPVCVVEAKKKKRTMTETVRGITERLVKNPHWTPFSASLSCSPMQVGVPSSSPCVVRSFKSFPNNRH